ncbi:helix-turn-helix domain-containing protein [Paenibacillus odorifer]|uniref:helix-turn-helix domain-containing protein n=1 Tax=Paenibacillus odorifer TaxID=189426 RepID=UPI0028996C2E|nr:helix-turn-helix transcriptional regulator [Paenibacillus odorifer]
MEVCYNKLFKLLIDKSMKKTDLRKMTGISPNTLTKLSNNEFVSMEVLVKVCRTLECDFGDIVEMVTISEHGMRSSVQQNERVLGEWKR